MDNILIYFSTHMFQSVIRYPDIIVRYNDSHIINFTIFCNYKIVGFEKQLTVNCTNFIMFTIFATPDDISMILQNNGAILFLYKSLSMFRNEVYNIISPILVDYFM